MTFSIPPTETLAETKTCKYCGADFPITDKDLEFYDKVSPVFAGKKYPIPAPTLCPDCRQQRRLSWRNERKLYKGVCGATGKSVISVYSPDKPFKAYHQDFWWSDAWNPLSYGREFDFTRSFFDQFRELQLAVPRISVLNGFSENADFGNHSYHNKNSYSVNSCGYVEDSFYCVDVSKSSDCVDCNRTYSSSHCYECVNCKNCSDCQFSDKCHDCHACYLSVGCLNCKNCLGCKNLQNQEYVVCNRKVTKEEFRDALHQYRTDPIFRKGIQMRFEELSRSVPSKFSHNQRSENLFHCDNCKNCSDLKYSFDCEDSKNLAYCYDIVMGWATDCYDYTIYGENSSRIYEVHCSWATENILFSNVIWWGNHIFYSDNCLNNSNHCFGCVALRSNESYCVLNKQYSKEEYEALVPKIIAHMMETGEWGEFFPSSISPFGYNETVAQEYFPMTREEALAKGFNWSDYEPPFPKVEKTIPAAKLPQNIDDVPDDILNWAIECEVTKKPFRIIKQELEFYRKHNLPIPRRHPDQRHADRMDRRISRKTFERACDCPNCAKNNASPNGMPARLFTTYSPERPEKIYCETCYAKEVVG